VFTEPVVHRACNVNALLTLALAFIAAILALQTAPAEHVGTNTSGPLEFRLTKPLEWEHGCLQVRFDLANRSAKPAFLPTTGVSIDSSAKFLSSVPEKNGMKEWLNVYGASDIIMPLQVEPIAPHGSTHKEYCVGPTVDVVSAVYESWRQIPVRGTLRISASYYLSDPNRRPPQTKILAARPSPRIATFALPIPCPGGGCDFGCTGPPLIVEGENQVVPNITPHDQAWIERGNETNARLRSLYPCSK
jgi:hypothetical protein